MVVDTNSIEAGVLATGDERRDVGQRPANRNSQSDAEPAHLKCSFIRRSMLHSSDGGGQPMVVVFRQFSAHPPAVTSVTSDNRRRGGGSRETMRGL
jgi:hypothetical protein